MSTRTASDLFVVAVLAVGKRSFRSFDSESRQYSCESSASTSNVILRLAYWKGKRPGVRGSLRIRT